MIRMTLMVGIGGFFGSIGRYLLYQLFLKLIPGINPIGTLVVNILGSFILGFLIHSTSKLEKDYFLLLTSGFCGGFTTFSTFSVENIQYLTEGNILGSITYSGLSLVFGIGAAYLGWVFGKNILTI